MEITNYIAGFALIASLFNIFLYTRQDRRTQQLITAEKKGTLLVRVYGAREVQRGVVQVLNEIERLGETTFKEERVKGEKLLEEYDYTY